MEDCTLCGNNNLAKIVPAGDKRSYYLCKNCYLIIADPSWHPEKQHEKKRYLEHNNDESDPGYINFLKKLINPALAYLTPDMHGVDFGCGPVPALSNLLAEKGFVCDNYDPLFDFNLNRDAYDFIFASECFEHFHYPGRDLAFIDELLVKGGFLFIMSEQWENLERFENWYYKRDFTHVSFFHLETFNYISKCMNYVLEYTDNHRLVFFRKA